MWRWVKRFFLGVFHEEEKRPRRPMREMTDAELSGVVGQAGGLFLTESFGFQVPADMGGSLHGIQTAVQGGFVVRPAMKGTAFLTARTRPFS